MKYSGPGVLYFKSKHLSKYALHFVTGLLRNVRVGVTVMQRGSDVFGVPLLLTPYPHLTL